MVGYSGADDAAIYRIAPDRALVMTVDFFPPMVDDPFVFGQVAAANALSDVFAMGGRPLVALNLVGFPSTTLSLDILGEILRGGAVKVHEAGCVIGGGHTIEDAEVKYGLSVTGEVHPDRVWKNGAVKEGDLLVLTKPLGTGLASSAIKKEGRRGGPIADAERWMATLNSVGIEHLWSARVSSATDITGFGLLGHARELVAGSGWRLRIRASAVPRLAGIEELYFPKMKTGGAKRTREYVKKFVTLPADLDEWSEEILYDPQTSGGLLAAIDPRDAESVVRRLRDSGLERAAIVGEVIPGDGSTDIEVVR